MDDIDTWLMLEAKYRQLEAWDGGKELDSAKGELPQSGGIHTVGMKWAVQKIRNYDSLLQCNLKRLRESKTSAISFLAKGNVLGSVYEGEYGDLNRHRSDPTDLLQLWRYVSYGQCTVFANEPYIYL